MIVTENLFGDILSDEASVLAGSLGMLPSASIGERAPPTASTASTSRSTARRRTSPGSDVANPIGTILSGAMLLRWSLGQADAAAAVEGAVAAALDAGVRTRDLMPAGAARGREPAQPSGRSA